MLTAGVATYRLWRERGGAVPALMAGHSLGEFSALVAAGCLDFKDRGRSGEVSRRGDAGRGAAGPGRAWPRSWVSRTSMSRPPAHEAAQGEVVEAVNFNAPGQVVIAGHAAAVARAIEAATAKGARRAMALPISVPAHSSLMAAGGGAAARAARERRACTPAPRGSRSTGSTSRCTRTPGRYSRGAGQTAAYAGVLGRHGAHHDRRRRHRIVECGPGKVLTRSTGASTRTAI